MTPEKFVKGFYLEKQSLLKEYLSENPKTEVGQLLTHVTHPNIKRGMLCSVVC